MVGELTSGRELPGEERSNLLLYIRDDKWASVPMPVPFDW